MIPTTLENEELRRPSVSAGSAGPVPVGEFLVGVAVPARTPALPAFDTVRVRGFGENNPGQTELWRRYHSAGPGDASEEELVTRYLPLVKSVVGRLAISLPPHVDTQELHSAGLIGLLNALRQFDPKLGAAFEPYARLRIRGAVLDELRRMDWIPRSVHAKARKIQNAMQELERASGNIPSDVQVAAALKISVAEYEKWLEEIRPVTFISLDAVNSFSSPNAESEGEMREHEVFGDDTQEDPREKASDRELWRLIAERIKQLPEMQKKVLALYYYEGLRLNEIAQAFGCCNSHVCQTHAKALLAIRSSVEQYESSALKRKQP